MAPQTFTTLLKPCLDLGNQAREQLYSSLINYLLLRFLFITVLLNDQIIIFTVLDALVNPFVIIDLQDQFLKYCL